MCSLQDGKSPFQRSPGPLVLLLSRPMTPEVRQGGGDLAMVGAEPGLGQCKRLFVAQTCLLELLQLVMAERQRRQGRGSGIIILAALIAMDTHYIGQHFDRLGRLLVRKVKAAEDRESVEDLRVVMAKRFLRLVHSLGERRDCLGSIAKTVP